MLQTSALPWPTTLGLGTVLSIWLTLGIIVVLSLLLGYGALWLRKHNDPTDVQGDELSLADLRRMKAEGTITAEEFDAAKAALLARMGVMRGEALTTAENSADSPDSPDESNDGEDPDDDGGPEKSGPESTDSP